MAHSGEFGCLIAILNQAGPDGQDLVGWKKARKDSADQPKQQQQLVHPSHFLFEEFGRLGNSAEG